MFYSGTPRASARAETSCCCCCCCCCPSTGRLNVPASSSRYRNLHTIHADSALQCRRKRKGAPTSGPLFIFRTKANAFASLNQSADPFVIPLISVDACLIANYRRERWKSSNVFWGTSELVALHIRSLSNDRGESFPFFSEKRRTKVESYDSLETKLCEFNSDENSSPRSH